MNHWGTYQPQNQQLFGDHLLGNSKNKKSSSWLTCPSSDVLSLSDNCCCCCIVRAWLYNNYELALYHFRQANEIWTEAMWYLSLSNQNDQRNQWIARQCQLEQHLLVGQHILMLASVISVWTQVKPMYAIRYSILHVLLALQNILCTGQWLHHITILLDKIHLIHRQGSYL
jgi:hypothetical protein